MNCLKCLNYWKTNIDETQCDKCGTQETATTDNQKGNEEQSNGEKVFDLR